MLECGIALYYLSKGRYVSSTYVQDHLEKDSNNNNPEKLLGVRKSNELKLRGDIPTIS
jgi:hypothetical protein